MQIGILDVDSHNFPNLSLMKISAYHKSLGDDVEWWLPLKHYDIVYASKVFQMIISALGKSCEQDVVRALSPMCPRCRALVWDNQRYCFMCGQKLRWKNE